MNPQAGEILIFNKPYRWTSFNVVAKVRGELSHRLGVKKLKVGHAGTLDPLATGVLIICTGKSTKLIDELQAHTKEYVATIKLGATTPSFDMETAEDATYPTEHITRELVEEKLKAFVGRIEQIPPTFSAVKVDGKRAFKYARKGEDIEYMTHYPWEREECRNCEVLPICMGGCPFDYVENHKLSCERWKYSLIDSLKVICLQRLSVANNA